VIIKSYNPLSIVNLKCPKNMGICAAVPNIETPPDKTKKARSIISKMVPMEKHIYSVGKAAAMASAFANGDVDLIGESMSDSIVEPKRATFIPGYQKVKENAFKAGACGVAISGAGPAIIAIVNNENADAAKVAHAMQKGFETATIESFVFVTKPGEGTCLCEMR
jgi:homoserine kinase